MADSFEVIVIGSGPGGYRAAMLGALRGLRVAVVGSSVAATEASELIHLLSLAPDRETALSLLAAGRYNHPTRAEELLNATETLAGKWGLGKQVFG